MSDITIRINTDNAAFAPDPSPELARILRKLADDIESGRKPHRLADINGNAVGGVWED